MTEFALTAAVPGVEEYRKLRVAAGLSAKSKLAAERGLAGSLFAVCIRNDDTLIGMGRIIGDGAPALYQKFGFEFTAPVSVGMAIRL